MKKLFHRLDQFLRQETGATAPEYAIIIALVTTGLAAAALSLGDAVQEFFADSAQLVPNCAQAPGQSGCFGREQMD